MAMTRASTRIDAPPSPRPVLLGFLMIGPAHPYGLYRLFDAELGRVWRLGRSHLYAHLSRLAASGMATTRKEGGGRRPARNVYSITPAGRRAFREWMRTPTRHVRNMRLEFLARLYFHRRLDLPGLDSLVSRQKEILRIHGKALRGEIAESADTYWRLVLSFRLCEMKALSAWLDGCTTHA